MKKRDNIKFPKFETIEQLRGAKYFDFINTFIVTIDSNRKIVLLNKKGYEILGYKKGELIGKDWFRTCLPKENLREAMSVFKKCMSGKIKLVEHHDNPVLTKKGEKRIISWHNALLKDKGKINGTLSIGDDITEKKKAKEFLKESEERYRGWFEGAQDAIFIADAETGILLDCNESACELVERKKSEIIGQNQKILHPPEKIKGQFSRTFKKHLKEKEGQALEAQVITKKGDIKDVAIKAKLLEFKGKKVMQGIFRDVTERKKAERALRESEEKYKQLYEGSQDGWVLVDMKGNIKEFNSKYAGMLGYTPEELQKRAYVDLTPKKWQEIESKIVREQIIPNGYSETYQKEYQRKDGTIFPIELRTYLIKNKLGKPAGMWAFIHDITERKKAEEKIRQSQEMLQKIINLLPIRIFWKDRNLNYVGCNEAFAKDAGKNNPEELTGKDDFQMGWKEQAKLYRSDDKKVIKSGISKINYEEPQTTPYGKKIWLLATKVPLKDEKGRILGILGTYSDITEKKKAEDEISKRAEELERFNKMAIGRELKMVELKNRIRELEGKLKG